MAKGTKRAKRRGNQEGSIFQRKDGRWVAQITYRGIGGVPKLVPQYFSTQAEARRALTATKSKQDAHRLVITGKATVREWLDVWLEEFVKPNRAKRTYKGYYDVLKQHLPEEMGKLGRIAPETLQRVFNSISAAGHGRTAELLRAVLRSAFNRAVKLRRMESNPVLGTEPAKYTPQETDTWTPVEAARFLQAVEGVRNAALYICALSLGLRKGEASGLRPEDLDLESRVLHVRRTLAWVKEPGQQKGQWEVSAPKRNSIRDLRMSETVYRACIRHLTRRAEEAVKAKNWNDSGYLFVTPTGAPIHEKSITNVFHAVCDAAGIPRLRFHDTRHTCGTLLHVQGADPFVIKEVLGHSQLSTTKRYTHVPIQVTGAALDGLDALLKAAKDALPSRPATVKTTVKSDGQVC
jgi:integrase